MPLTLKNYLLLRYWYNNPSVFFQEVTKALHPPDGYTPSKKQQELFDLVKNKVLRILLSACNAAGKTLSTAVISILISAVWSEIEEYPYKALCISGSWQQANVLHDYIRELLKHPILNEMIRGEATATKVYFKNGGSIRTFTGSEKQVYGQHTDLYILDEAVLIEDIIIDDIYSRISGSPLGMILMTSTPEVEHYFSKFISIYENEKDYPEWIRLNWSALDCPWKSIKEMNEARLHLSKAKFKAKWEGLPSFEARGALFDTDKIRKEVRVKPEICKFDKAKPTSMGIDWGFKHPTVIAIFQEENDIKYMVYCEDWKQKPWDYIKARIIHLANEYNVQIIHADAEDPWRMDELKKLKELQGVQINPVHFRGEKAKLQFNLQTLIEKGQIKIPETYSEALRQLSVYTEDTKLNDDFVDAIMLGVKSKLKWEKDPWFFVADDYTKYSD